MIEQPKLKMREIIWRGTTQIFLLNLAVVIVIMIPASQLAIGMGGNEMPKFFMFLRGFRGRTRNFISLLALVLAF